MTSTEVKRYYLESLEEGLEGIKEGQVGVADSFWESDAFTKRPGQLVEGHCHILRIQLIQLICQVFLTLQKPLGQNRFKLIHG